MVRFRIPPQHKETVTVIRGDAYHRGNMETVATDVVCMISPDVQNARRRGDVRVASGVAVNQVDATALLEKPNPNIVKGDFLVRSDGDRFRIETVLAVKGSPIMQLFMTQIGVL